MTWINKIVNPKAQSIESIKKISKGWIIQTMEYDCFLYDSSALVEQILELRDYFIKNPDDMCEVIVVPDKTEKVGFRLELGNQAPWIITDDKMKCHADNASEASLLSKLRAKLDSNGEAKPSPHPSDESDGRKTTGRRSPNKYK